MYERRIKFATVECSRTSPEHCRSHIGNRGREIRHRDVGGVWICCQRAICITYRIFSGYHRNWEQVEGFKKVTDWHKHL